MASIAAGNAGVSVQVPGQRLGPYGGIAPQARIAVYKACWSAPDPADDGCATADLVTAIDRATGDGVDVLNLSVGGPSTMDTVERALLGAAEKDIVVVAAAGNRGRSMYAAHPSPWVTSVGGTTGDVRLGSVTSPAAPSSTARWRRPAPARPGSWWARRCRPRGASPGVGADLPPGSLDASRTEGAIVAVRARRHRPGREVAGRRPGRRRRDGPRQRQPRRGRVRPAQRPDRAPGRGAATTCASGRPPPARRVTLDRRGLGAGSQGHAWSAAATHRAPWSTRRRRPGRRRAGRRTPSVLGTRWDFVTGTSAAAAWTSGLALRLGRPPLVRRRRPVGPDHDAASVTGRPLGAERGRRPPRSPAQHPGLLPRRHRRLPRLARRRPRRRAQRAVDPAPERPGPRRAHGHERRSRRGTFTVSVTGFTDHPVRSPRPRRLRPGRSRTFRSPSPADPPTGRQRLGHLGRVQRHHRPDPGRLHLRRPGRIKGLLRQRPPTRFRPPRPP